MKQYEVVVEQTVRSVATVIVDAKTPEDALVQGELGVDDGAFDIVEIDMYATHTEEVKDEY